MLKIREHSDDPTFFQLVFQPDIETVNISFANLTLRVPLSLMRLRVLASALAGGSVDANIWVDDGSLKIWSAKISWQLFFYGHR